MKLLELASSLPTGRCLASWQGIVLDKVHPMLRADRIRLAVVGRNPDGRLGAESVAGYRPAAVLPKETLAEDDYRLEFSRAQPLYVIDRPSSRAGRHARGADILPDENVTLAGDRWQENGGRPPPWVYWLDTALQAYLSNERLCSRDTLPLPRLWLCSRRSSNVFLRQGAESSAPETDSDHLRYNAAHWYGQGVLAMPSGFPAGHWFDVPCDWHGERPDLLVDLRTS